MKLVKEQGLAKLLVESNCIVLEFIALPTNNVVVESEDDETQEPSLGVSAKFYQSYWYKDIIFSLKIFSCSLSMG
jgi:hypothetical protein